MKKHIFDMISRYMLNLYQFPQYWVRVPGQMAQSYNHGERQTQRHIRKVILIYLMIQFNFTNEHLNYVINLEIVQCSYNLKIWIIIVKTRKKRYLTKLTKWASYFVFLFDLSQFHFSKKYCFSVAQDRITYRNKKFDFLFDKCCCTTTTTTTS